MVIKQYYFVECDHFTQFSSSNVISTLGGGGSRKEMSQTPMTASNRDQLGLNRPDSTMHPGMEVGDDVSISGTSFATSVGDHSMSIKEIARAERRAAKKARKDLEMALASLPAPQFEYELAAPDAVTDDEEARVTVEKDAADLEAEELARLEKEAAESYAKRSSVVKRLDLPRPVGVITEDHLYATQTGDSAEDLINNEMFVLLQHDAYTHPYVRVEDEAETKKSKKGKKKNKKTPVATEAALPPEKPIQYIEEGALDFAKRMIDEEFETVIQEKRQAVANNNSTFESDELVKNYLNSETIKAAVEADGQGDTLESTQSEFSSIKEAIASMKKRTDKLEMKLSIKNGGYTKRVAAMQESIGQDFSDLQNSAIEEYVFTALMKHEQRGVKDRIEKLEEETENVEKAEAQLQKQYGDLLHERSRQKLLLKQKQN